MKSHEIPSNRYEITMKSYPRRPSNCSKLPSHNSIVALQALHVFGTPHLQLDPGDVEKPNGLRENLRNLG
jgi:hypothetical protein